MTSPHVKSTLLCSPMSSKSKDETTSISSRLRTRESKSNPFISTPMISTPVLRSKRKLICDPNNENNTEAHSSPVKKPKNGPVSPEEGTERDDGVSQEKGEIESGHTPQGLQLRLSSKCGLENKENNTEAHSSPVKKTKNEPVGPEEGRERDAGVSQEKGEIASDHTPQGLRLRLSSKCGLEEKIERLREYRASLTLDYESHHLESYNLKRLKDRDNLIKNLKMRIVELESQADGNSDSASDESTSVQKLLQQLQQMQVENYDLVAQLAGFETAETTWKSKCHSLNVEVDQLTREKDSISEKLNLRISTLEGNVQCLKEENDRQVEKVMKLKDENEKLKAEQLVLSEEQRQSVMRLKEELNVKDSRIEEAEQLSCEERNEKLEIIEMLLEEKKRHTGISQGRLLLLQEEIESLKKSHVAAWETIKDQPSAMQDFMRSTIIKVQDAIQETSQTNQELVKRYAREIRLRKRYHNQLVELRGNIRVFCRVRPSNDGEHDSLSFDSHDDGILRISHKGRNQMFEFDKVFNNQVTQSQIFEEVSDLVKSVLDGYNVCIFAYGQTGSGKTYTMEGPSHDPGLNQRALQFLFEEAQGLSWSYTIEASVLEVYNETLRDLLNPNARTKLEVKLKADGGLNVPGLVKVLISSLEEANRVFQMGCENRAIEATNMNEHSSRSHCLLCLTVTGTNALTGNKCLGHLNLVDLAGSERVDKSLAEGLRLKEAQNINKSLASLGDVINALKNKHTHVPYRNSKLTYLLQDSLGGDGKTLMILQASPEEVNASETACTLAFGQRVRSAELGAATRRIEDGTKGTPNSVRRAFNIDTPHASPTPSYSGRPGTNHSAPRRKL